MKTMTLRGIDELLARQLSHSARQHGQSINQFILDILRTQLGLHKGKKHTAEHKDLDHLFGKWSEEEFLRIQGKIDSERRIDPELWS